MWLDFKDNWALMGNPMSSQMVYWLKGESTQNFGDYLSEYFQAHLFYGDGISAPNVRLIGSCIDDGLIDNLPPKEPTNGTKGMAAQQARVIFWGCGLRRADGLSKLNLSRVEILSVRGPLTRSALRLGSMVPMGDPGLLLPALYDPQLASATRDASVIVPHFHDQRSDEELLTATGCDVVLRPNVPNNLEAIERFIDQLVAAKFLLTGSLHAAVAAVAYGKPFAFWDSGNIDLPFKWQDFAASLSIPCQFFVDAVGARRHYESAIRKSIKLPTLWPSLTVAPFPVRASVMKRVIQFDLERHGASVLSERATRAVEHRIQEEQTARAAAFTKSVLDAKELRATNDILSHQVAEHDGRLQESAAAAALREVQFREELNHQIAERDRLQKEQDEATALRELQFREELNRQFAERDRFQQEQDAAAALLEGRLRQAEQQISELNATVQLERDRVRQANSALALSAQTVEQLTATLDRTSGEVGRLKALVDEYLDAIANLRAQLDGRSAEVSGLESSLKEHQSQIHDRDVRLSHFQFELDRARVDFNSVKLEIEALQAKHMAQTNEVSRLHSHCDNLQVAESSLRNTLQQVMASKSWRLTAPLRDLNLRAPKLSRNLQRLAKLVWWILTLQLVSNIKAKRQIREQLSCLSQSELLDQNWYRTMHPDVAAAGADVAEHYFWFGAKAGLDPHPLFDTSWYLQQYPEVNQSGLNPLVHYLRIGAAAGFAPHPLFDSDWYSNQHPEIKANWTDPLVHYLLEGAKAGFDPNPWFDSDKYLLEYPEAATYNGPPLLHYVLVGSEKHFDPHPLFDSRWYSAKYEDQRRGMEPLAHYLSTGIGLGCLPSPALANLSIEGSGLPSLAFPEYSDPVVTIIIPTYKQYFYTYRCLYSIMLNTGTKVNYEVIVADDYPEHVVGESLAGVPGLRVIMNPQNLGFLRNCNHASQLSTAKYIVFLNNDTVVARGWLDHLVRTAEADPSVALVGGKLLNPDGTIQEAGGIIFSDGWGHPYGAGDAADKGQYNYLRQVDCIIGACFLVRRSQFEEVGRFDEAYAPAFYEEFDLAFSLQERGYRAVYQPAAEIIHFGSQSYGPAVRDALSLKNHNIFTAKWARRLSERPDRRQSLFLARELRRTKAIILVIDDGLPQWDKHAGALTLYQYLQLMVGMDFRVIFCGANLELLQPYGSVLQQCGIEVIYKPETLESWLQQNGKHLDYVWTARPDVSGNLIPVIRAHSDAKILYYTHDLHYLREWRRYILDGDAWALGESNRLRDVEFGIFRGVDCVMTPSCEEVKIIKEAVPSANVREVLPYFYTPDSIIGKSSFSNRHDMVFVGGFGHPPNVDAAAWLVNEILPLVWKQLPSARLLIIGSNPPAAVTTLANDRVEVVGYVPEVEPYYERARISINPLRYGAGVKGKIVASLRSGVPVVTTPIGNEGIGLRDGMDGFIGDSPEALAERILSLYHDDALCARFADAGRSVIRRQFSVMKARRILGEVMGIETCVACGAPSQASTDARNRSWYERPGCNSCGSSNLALMVASVVLEPFRQEGISTLGELLNRVPQLDVMDSGLFRWLKSPSEVKMPATSRAVSAKGYDLIIGAVWDEPENLTAEQLWQSAEDLRVGGRLVCTTAAIADIESAWRSAGSHTARIFADNDGHGRLIIHEIAPNGLDPNVGVIELCR